MNLQSLTKWFLPAVPPGCTLSIAEGNTLAKLAEVALAGAPLTITPDEVARNVDAFLSASRSRHAWRCRVLLILVEHAPLVLGAPRFSNMTRQDRAALVEERFARGTGLWWICANARSLVLLGGYGDPHRYARGWDVPLSQRVRFRGPLKRGARS